MVAAYGLIAPEDGLQRGLQSGISTGTTLQSLSNSQSRLSTYLWYSKQCTAHCQRSGPVQVQHTRAGACANLSEV